MSDASGPTFHRADYLDYPGLVVSSAKSMDPQGETFLVTPHRLYNAVALWTREEGWGELIGTVGGMFPHLCEDGTVVANGGSVATSSEWPGTCTGVLNEWDCASGGRRLRAARIKQYDGVNVTRSCRYTTGLTWEGCIAGRAFLWDRDVDSTVSLGIPNERSTRGNAIADDGPTVVGCGTMANGTRRGAVWRDGEWSSVDDRGDDEPLTCVESGGQCWGNLEDGGCPVYVDDAHCGDETRGKCVDGQCVGGPDAGNGVRSRMGASPLRRALPRGTERRRKVLGRKLRLSRFAGVRPQSRLGPPRPSRVRRGTFPPPPSCP